MNNLVPGDTQLDLTDNRRNDPAFIAGLGVGGRWLLVLWSR